jgi:hypothetical protein
MRNAATFIFAGAIPALPWYWRNLAESGNPVFPFFSRVFANFWWTPGDVARWNHVMATRYGTGTSLKALVMLPWSLMSKPLSFWPEANVPFWIPTLALLGTLFALLDRTGRMLASMIAVFVAVWFFTSQQGRYLIPVAPVAAVVSASLLDWVVGWSRRNAGGRLATLLAAMALVSAGPITAWRWVVQQSPFPTDAASRAKWLTRLPPAAAYDFLNRRSGSHYRAYGLDGAYYNYYPLGERIGDAFGPFSYVGLRPAFHSGRTLWRALRSLDVDFLVVVERAPFANLLPTDDSFARNFKPIYADARTVIYQLSNSPFKGR